MCHSWFFGEFTQSRLKLFTVLVLRQCLRCVLSRFPKLGHCSCYCFGSCCMNTREGGRSPRGSFGSGSQSFPVANGFSCKPSVWIVPIERWSHKAGDGKILLKGQLTGLKLWCAWGSCPQGDKLWKELHWHRVMTGRCVSCVFQHGDNHRCAPLFQKICKLHSQRFRSSWIRACL